MRRAFVDTLTDLAARDERIALVTADFGYGLLDDFRDRFPQRFINVGICEQNMVAVCAGLALEGMRPVAYTIAAFIARAYEQIRFCVAYPRLPVIIVGAGRGLTYAKDGPSHVALDDLGLMSLVPGMGIVSPGSPEEVRDLLPQMVQESSPWYFTVGRYGEPDYPSEEPPVLGKARLLRSGHRIAILCTGETAGMAMKAADIASQQGISPFVYQIHTLCPMDTELLVSLDRYIDTILVIEEHGLAGGLWSTIASFYVGSLVTLRRIGPLATPIDKIRDPESYRVCCGLSVENITQSLYEL